MERLAIAISLLLALSGLTACASGASGGGDGSDAPTSYQSSAVGNAAQFHELSFLAPSGWIDKATETTDSVDDGRMWHDEDDGGDWELRDGGMFAFSMNYDFLDNLDVGLSGYEGDAIREAETYMQTVIKTVDGRLCAKFVAETYSATTTTYSETDLEVGKHVFSVETRSRIDEKSFALDNQNGCAVWSIESKDNKGTMHVCATPYDDHVIVVVIASAGDDFSAEEKAVIDSLSFASAPNSEFYETAKPMVGKTSEEVLRDASSTIGSLQVKTGTAPNGSSENPSAGGSGAKPKTIEPTTGMQNAYRTANDYLKVMAFSRSGLVNQLKHDGYTSDEAEYAVSELEQTGVDWNVMATRSAEEYLKIMSLSKSQLVDQLKHDGFTSAQAQHAADMVY